LGTLKFIIISPSSTLNVDFYSANYNSLKQQSAGRDVARFGRMILIPSQPVIARSL